MMQTMTQQRTCVGEYMLTVIYMPFGMAVNVQAPSSIVHVRHPCPVKSGFWDLKLTQWALWQLW